MVTFTAFFTVTTTVSEIFNIATIYQLFVLPSACRPISSLLVEVMVTDGGIGTLGRGVIEIDAPTNIAFIKFSEIGTNAKFIGFNVSYKTSS